MILSAVKWNGLSAVFLSAIQACQMLLVGFFLPAEDLGLLALCQVVTGLGYLLMDGGLSNLIIQKQVLSDAERSTLLILSCVVAFSVMAVIFTTSNFIAGFYDSPRLSMVLKIYSMVFFLAPFNQILSANAQRELLFKDLAYVDLISIAVAFVLVFLALYAGFGVYSVVVGVYANLVVRIVALRRVVLDVCSFSGGFDRCFFVSSLSFGFFQLGERLVNLVSTQIDSLMVGKLLGMEQLGVYSLAKNLVMKAAQVFYSVISKTAFPLLSRVEGDSEAFSMLFNRMYLGALTIALMLFVLAVYVLKIDWAFLAENEKLSQVALLAPVFCVLAFSSVNMYLISSAMLAHRKVACLFWGNVVMAVGNFTVLMLLDGFSLYAISVCMVCFHVFVSSIIYNFLYSSVFTVGYMGRVGMVLLGAGLIFALGMDFELLGVVGQ